MAHLAFASFRQTSNRVPGLCLLAIVVLMGLGWSAHAVEATASRPGLQLAPGVLRKAPPLPPPAGRVVKVSTVEQLFEAARTATPGTTILIAPGRYILPRRLEIRTDRVSLRGATGQREDVILDGKPHQLGELLAVHACSDVLIADLTIENVRWNGIKLDTDSGVHRVTIYNCVLHNIWQRAVKGVRVPKGVLRPEGVRIQFCLFYNDRAKSYADDPADTEKNFRGNYIGGIDTMFAQGWIISDNTFYNIQGRTREGRGAVFLWHESADCIVERNVFINCDVGVALGNSHKPEDIDIHVRRTIVRNNFIVGCPESGIVADYTERCLIAHNTIYDPQNRLGRLIRLVHDNPGLIVANNLLVGPPIRNESASAIQFLNNVVISSELDIFVNAPRGDLHLKTSHQDIVDQAAALKDVTMDFDGDRRDSRPDIGADEFNRLN